MSGHPMPCGCTDDQLCPQHVQALPRRERLAYEVRQRAAERAAEFQQRRAEQHRARAAFTAARAAGKRAHHAQRIAQDGSSREQ